jgi:DnaJ-class molecular chaperone
MLTVIVEPDAKFERRGDDVCTILDIDAFEAMLGCTKKVKTIDDKTIQIKDTARDWARRGVCRFGNGLSKFKNRQNRQLCYNHVISTCQQSQTMKLKTKLENIRNEFNSNS